ncbi:MAG: hypothetical protein WAQ08_16080 [Aquabacterium sp.]|uniref:hypothetical protein n=1 Tax=Aquabacterium sp. TaxID=1872578 RepID=UPI003BB090A0
MLSLLARVPPWGWGLLAVVVGAGLVLGARALYQYGYDVRDTECQASTATTTGQRLTVALDGSQAFRAAEGQSFKQRAGAADAYDKTFAADVAAAGVADAAGAGLRVDIDAAVATACGAGVQPGAAPERSGPTVRALGAALAACDSEQRSLAADLARSLRAGKRCEAEHRAAEALNVPVQVETQP